jgi:hypothetical protein
MFAPTLGLSIVGMVLCAVDLKAGGEAQGKNAPAVSIEQIPTLPAKVLREQIPTLPAKILKEQIPTLPTKVLKEQIPTLPAMITPKEKFPAPPVKEGTSEVPNGAIVGKVKAVDLKANNPNRKAVEKKENN